MYYTMNLIYLKFYYSQISCNSLSLLPMGRVDGLMKVVLVQALLLRKSEVPYQSS